MERKDFIKKCGLACLGGVGVATLVSSCSTARMVDAPVEDNALVVSLERFWVKGDQNKGYHRSIVVQNDLLKFPIWVFRHDEKTYTAHWMRCTHQGVELTSYGDKLHCSAHGSEFDSFGKVTSGPANETLREFDVQVGEKQLKIGLQLK